MEVNKDEAERCLSFARTHSHSGNIASAIKFAEKSLRLFPTQAAEDLLEQLKKKEQSGSTSDASTSAKATGAEAHPSASGTTHRHTTATSSSSAGSSTGSDKKRDFTPEQAAVVKRVRSCKVTAYYEILELKKDCDENDVKKAYRKLALLLHPDKNGAPGADEAFKLVSKAFQVLSDTQMRAAYDSNPGRDPESRGGGPSMAEMFGRRQGQGGFQAEMSPEDLFNAFFGGGFDGFGPGATTFTFGPGGFTTFRAGPGFRTRQHAARQNAPAPQGARGLIMQLLPIIILLAFSFLGSLPSLFSSTPNHPAFSFSKTDHLSQVRQTSRLNVPYYVNPTTFYKHSMWESVPEAQRAKQEAGQKALPKQLSALRLPTTYGGSRAEVGECTGILGPWGGLGCCRPD
ncbi:hypothetical protein FRC02_005177 [Tulasnella sp. 418]|nr:hypothetical protein FRC02_005177 [Tulasnella sp. 418]